MSKRKKLPATSLGNWSRDWKQGKNEWKADSAIYRGEPKDQFENEIGSNLHIASKSWDG